MQKIALLEARTDKETKNLFKARAKKMGLTESKLLLRLVMAELEKEISLDENRVEPDANNALMEKVTVLLPNFLKQAAKARAKIKFMPLSRWIAALVQSNLTGLPVMTKKEIYALESSNRELAAIGRNINQIARTLNEAFYKTEAVRLEKLAELNREIFENRKVIRELIKASRNVWDAD